MQNITTEEKTLLIQGLAALNKRLRGKVNNDLKHGRNDHNRVAARTAKIAELTRLMEKMMFGQP